MVTSTAEQDRERLQKEREARRLEDLAAEQRLEEEPAKAEAVEEEERKQAAEDTGANKRPRSGESPKTPVFEVQYNIVLNTKDKPPLCTLQLYII
jgi:hypothetical protein